MTDHVAGHDVQRSIGAVVGRALGLRVHAVPTLVLSELSARWASRTLSTRFLVASFAVLCTTLLISGVWMEERIKSSLVQAAAHASAHVIDSVVEPRMQELATQRTLSEESRKVLYGLVQNSSSSRKILRIKIWLPDGTLAFSNDGIGIGQAPPITTELKMALQGTVAAQFENRHEFDSLAQPRHVVPIFEVYSPVFRTGTTEIIAVAEFYEDATTLREQIAAARRQAQIVIGAITIGMLLLLFRIVQGGSAIILAQKSALETKYVEQTELLRQNEELRGRITRALYESAALSDKLMRRVGADLHDGPAQLLGLALLRLHELTPTAELERTEFARAYAEPVAAVRNHLEEAMGEIRSISSGLSLPELQSMTTEEVVRLAVRTHERRTKTSVRTQVGGLPDQVSPAAKACIFRSIQEGLTNAFRHAGAKGQFVGVMTSADAIKISVRDAGPGFTGTALRQGNEGLGLVGLRHRVELLGGTIEVRSHPGKGTQLSVNLPLAGVS